MLSKKIVAASQLVEIPDPLTVLSKFEGQKLNLLVGRCADQQIPHGGESQWVSADNNSNCATSGRAGTHLHTYFSSDSEQMNPALAKQPTAIQNRFSCVAIDGSTFKLVTPPDILFLISCVTEGGTFIHEEPLGGSNTSMGTLIGLLEGGVKPKEYYDFYGTKDKILKKLAESDKSDKSVESDESPIFAHLRQFPDVDWSGSIDWTALEAKVSSNQDLSEALEAIKKLFSYEKGSEEWFVGHVAGRKENGPLFELEEQVLKEMGLTRQGLKQAASGVIRNFLETMNEKIKLWLISDYIDGLKEYFNEVGTKKLADNPDLAALYAGCNFPPELVFVASGKK